MGEYRHASHARAGTLYNVCSRCADAYDEWADRVRMVSIGGEQEQSR